MIYGLKYDVISLLLKSEDKALKALVARDLLGKKVSAEELWEMPYVKRVLQKQRLDGSWKYSTRVKRGKQKNYDQYETYKKLGILVEKYGFNKNHPSIQKSADYFFSHQSKEGDFRGIYDSQYSPNYTAGITELLIKAGYVNDRRIEKVFKWLLSIRQKDGGWALPFRTRNHNINVTYSHSTTLEPDKSKPFSHMVTGVVLRAFAIHPRYKKSKAAKQAGELLLNNLFKKDNYPDRCSNQYWTRFSFPFCYTDLISSMDSISLLGFSRHNPQVERALEYFINNQQEGGVWKFNIVSGSNRDNIQLWLALSVYRMFKRLYS
jgi:hypothetical protein